MTSEADVALRATDSPRDVIAGAIEQRVLPGAVWAVEHEGNVQVECSGTMGFDDAAPVRRDTIFRITSMTKPITAAATMLLVDDGQLTLDEPVDRLLPELANRRVLRRLDGALDDTVPAARPITVRDLLAFTMGFGLVFPFDTYPIQKAANTLALNQGPPKPHVPPAPDEWLRRFATLPLMYQPGERWVYNTGADVLTVLVARASGMSFDAFLRTRLLEPLGMQDTGFSVPPEQLHRLPPAYMTDFASGELGVCDPRDGDWSRAPAFPSGAAGLVSTVDDYLAFARMLLAGGVHGSRRILSAHAVELMTTDHLTPQQKAVSGFMPDFFANRGWGFGIAITTGPDEISTVPGRYGWDGGMGTYWVNDPSRRLIGILLTQRAFDGQTMPIAQAFWRAVYRNTT